jgi:alkanesulfonate monooxygenase SsuD/methylene tetrahydromethanopterin reductase-like flavin-dependent oxidoreductase (luciferase family)
MMLGIFLNSQHPAGDDAARRLDETVEQVRLIRSLGFDSIWAGEHHVTQGFHFFPQMPLLHRIAADAEGLWIGTNLTLLPLHNPVEAAEVGAFLDIVTGGRFLLGVGLGYRPEEFAAYRVKMSERASRLAEGVEIIGRLWTEDRVTHQGRHWQLADVTVRPRPLQSPRPPILVGAQVEAAVARAARIGDGWLVVPTITRDELSAQMAFFAAARDAAGLPPAEHICRLIEVGCNADEDTAIHRTAPHLLAKYAAYASWGLKGVVFDAAAEPNQQLKRLAADRFAIGTPDQVAAMLLDQHRAGVTHVAMRVSWPGMEQQDILASIELLGREVLPKMRSAISSGTPG